jgi:hypothetical protein
MATAKLVKGRVSSPRPAATGPLARLSASMYHDTLEVFKELVKAGRSNLMQGYASSIILVDFLHSAGLTTDRAYEAVFLLSSIMDITAVSNSVFSTLFGNSALAPTLRTALDGSGGKGDEEDDGPESRASGVASTLALAAQIATAIA